MKPSRLRPKLKSDEAKQKHEEAPSESASAAEALLFEDPFKTLSQIAREEKGGSDGRIDKLLVVNDTNPPGNELGELTRDPFDPLAWKSIPMEPASEVETSRPAPPEPVKEEEKPEQHAAEPKEKPAQHSTENAASEAVVKQAESIRAALKHELEGLGSKHPDLDVKTTSEGVLISLTDSVSFDMFDVGSAKPRPVVVKLMEKVAAAVKDFDGRIIVRGHTDARPYRGKGYDNWRLSMARAQMAYYMLIRAGVDDSAVERIEGYADKSLLRRDQPQSAENRRIEILLRVPQP